VRAKLEAMWLLWACVAPSSDSGDSGDTGPASSEAWPGLATSAAWRSAESGYATGLGVSDVDGDGDGDVVVAYGNDMVPGPLAIYENEQGVLGETAAWTSEAHHYFGQLSIGDVDGDGADDLVVSRYVGDEGRFDEPGGVQLWLGANDGFELAWEDDGFYSFSCALGDVDGDGDLDLAVAVGEAYDNEPDRSRVYAWDAGFALVWETEGPRHSYDVGWTDPDGDGDLDLVFASVGSPHALYENDGGLSDAPVWEADGERFGGNTLDIGDLDGDGLVDLVISENEDLGGSGLVRGWCGPALSPCFTSGDGADLQSAVRLEDVDGDGDLDLAAGAWWGAVRLYENEAGLVATPRWTSEEDAIVAEALAFEDLDGGEEVVIEGHGLLRVPGRVVSVEGGVAAEGWASGPGSLTVRYLASTDKDLLVTDWSLDGGNLAYGRAR